MRALVIGASGFLGSRLLTLGPRDVERIGTGHARPVAPGDWHDITLDVTSPPAVRACIERLRPGAVLYVAYHAADRAITVDGARAAAQAAAARGARFLLTSTDLVFDGDRAPYDESALAEPVMPYGRLKVEAEVAVREVHPEAVVLRPALMAGRSRDHLRPTYEVDHLQRGQPFPAFVDEWRTPVHVDDVVRACWELVLGEAAGLFHLGGSERLSRFDFARGVARAHGFDPALVREAARPLDRPKDTSLDSTRITDFLGWSPRPALAAGASDA